MSERESAPFKVGDRVVVRWMGEDVQATIWQVKTGYRSSGRPYKQPRYRVEIIGAPGNPWYEHHEIEKAQP